MLIVTGASGQLGRKVVNHLLLYVPAERIGISVRNPDKVADLAALGVRVRQGDFDNAASLRHAWQGAERLLLVSSNAAATGGDPLKQHATAIDVAGELKVERCSTPARYRVRPARISRPGAIMLLPKPCWRSRVSPGRRCATGFTPPAPWP